MTLGRKAPSTVVIDGMAGMPCDLGRDVLGFGCARGVLGKTLVSKTSGSFPRGPPVLQIVRTANSLGGGKVTTTAGAQKCLFVQGKREENGIDSKKLWR